MVNNVIKFRCSDFDDNILLGYGGGGGRGVQAGIFLARNIESYIKLY